MASATSILPPELLMEVFKYVEHDYRILSSCVLVNKQWHDINISALWRNPFVCTGSIKILINCLLAKDKDFLVRNDIRLSFELLDRLPLYNYAKFAKILFISIGDNLKRMVDGHETDKIYCIR